MASLLEIIGQKEVALAEAMASREALFAEYGRLFGCLQGVKEGRIRIEDVTLTVSPTAPVQYSWQIVPDQLPDELGADAASALAALHNQNGDSDKHS